jgi:L-rhamnonate dehydratase
MKWLEDCLIPEDFEGFRMMRQRVPWQTLATGEHWYTPLPFSQAAAGRWVDIFQPDIRWVGGVTPCVKICHIGEAAGISVITHGGMNYPYGQHLAFAMPNIPWGECSGGVSAPGVPMSEATHIPGTAVPKDGYLVPSDAPGFGIEITKAQLEKWAKGLSRNPTHTGP